jgi:hypothetical protein
MMATIAMTGMVANNRLSASASIGRCLSTECLFYNGLTSQVLGDYVVIIMSFRGAAVQLPFGVVYSEHHKTILFLEAMRIFRTQKTQVGLI